jgi:hypothetical protein
MTKKATNVNDIKVEVKTKKVRVKAVKKDKKVDVVIDTPKVDVEIHKNDEVKEIILDTEKLDVKVTQTEEGTTVVVEAANPALERLGNWFAKLFKKNLDN